MVAGDADKAWKIVHEAILAFGMNIPDLAKARCALLRVIREEAWQHYVPPIGEPCDPANFQDWVTADIPRGLETTAENLLEIAKGDRALEDELDRLLKRPVGSNQYKEGVYIVNTLGRPYGNAATQALRRLREDAPELHDEVLAGRMSPHAAMVKAGFRPKTLTIRLDDPMRAAQSLLRQADPEFLAGLLRALADILADPEEVINDASH